MKCAAAKTRSSLVMETRNWPVMGAPSPPMPRATLRRPATRGAAAQERIALADAPVLAAVVTEVLPRLEPGGHRLGRGDRRPLVHEQLTQRGTAPRLPVVVLPAGLGDQAAQVRTAGRRGVADRVRDFV